MYAQFRYLDGPLAGEHRTIAADFATIGRHPGADVDLDPADGLEVSVRHAAVFKQGGAFLVRDLGSANGTFLNARRVRGDLPLAPGDVLRFGPDGPRLEFTISTVRALTPRAAPAAAATPSRPEIFGPRTRPAERPRAVPPRPARPWRWLVATVVVVGIVTASGAAWQARRTEERLVARRTALLAGVDDLQDRLNRAEGSAAGIAAALADARRSVGALRTSIANTALRPGALDTLAHAVTAQSERQEVVIGAASLDPAAVSGPSRAGLATLVARFPDGSGREGTAFAVRAAGDTIWLATARHLVQDSLGLPAIGLAVVLDGRTQLVPARVAKTHDSADAAIVVTFLRGGVPLVQGWADAVATGAPVAIVGYPTGLDSLGAWRRVGISASGSAGSVTRVGATTISIDGYGSPAANGSPVISATGLIVGLVSGRSGPDRGEFLVVPAAAVRRLLPLPASAP